MTWTENLPEVDGWYWWKEGIPFCEVGMVYVRNGHVVWDGYRERVEVIMGEWYGPIPLPVEKELAAKQELERLME